MARSSTSITMVRAVLKWIDEKGQGEDLLEPKPCFEYAVRKLMKRVAIRVRPRLAM